MSTPPNVNQLTPQDPQQRFLEDEVVEAPNPAVTEDLGGDDASDSREDLFDQECEVPQVVAASGFHAVAASDFNRIGLSDHETRIMVIRSAARRAANHVWVDPSAGSGKERAGQLTNIVWTTYRLIDPRYRSSSFQQIRVGRILPLVLSHASCMDIVNPAPSELPAVDQAPDPATVIPPADGPQDAVESADTGNRVDHVEILSAEVPVLFGHPLPVVVPPVSFTQPDTLGVKSVKKSKRVRQTSSVDPNSREAMQAFAELKSFSATRLWRTTVHDSRFLVALIGIISTAAIFLLVFAIRYSMTTPTVVTQTTEEMVSMNSKSNESVVPALPTESRAVDLHDSTLKVEKAEVESAGTLRDQSGAQDLVPKVVGAEEFGAKESSIEKRVTDETGVKDTRDLMTALTQATNQSEAELLEQFEAMSPQSLSAQNSTDAVDTKAPAGATELAEEIAPTRKVLLPEASHQQPRVIDSKVPSFSAADMHAAADDLWRNTPSAARKFTGASVGQLIDEWDMVAELAGRGSLEQAGAAHLSMQAAWLKETFASIAFRLREHTPQLENVATWWVPSQSISGELLCCHLNFDELSTLIESWKSARKRVVITADLNRMLHQGNVLIDRTLVSDRLQPIQRGALIDSLEAEVKRLASLAKDETLVLEFDSIMTAMDAFPEPSELARLESIAKAEAASDGSGFLGRVRCLKQRQWTVGLESLTHTTDPAIASCAKSEWQLVQSGTASQDDFAELANRWSKIAVRLPEREAASVRLHALQLYGKDAQYAQQRQQLLIALPRYLAPLASL